ncbi:MAG: twin-arginine translocation signal domain-containing protein, partial [Acidobacteria bacterium]|nr:twin-arginine translocation signal domain-containing protein [Acidobacteriota bacterium]
MKTTRRTFIRTVSAGVAAAAAVPGVH